MTAYRRFSPSPSLSLRHQKWGQPFDLHESGIRAANLAIVEPHAGCLKRWPGRKVTLEVRTDPHGGVEYNRALRQWRVHTVRQSRVLLDVIGQRIRLISFGMEKSAPTNATEAGVALNRRAELGDR